MLATALVLVSVLTLAAPAAAADAPPHYDRWETFGVGDGLASDKALCILAAGEVVWVGTDAGLSRYAGGEWRTFTTEAGLPHDAVLALAEDSGTGDVWIGTLGGLGRYSAGRFERFTQLNSGLVNNVIYGVTAHRGEVWSATAAGTSRFELAADRWTIYDETNTPMHEIWCYGVAGNKDRVYLAIWGAGLLEYDMPNDRWKRYHDPDGEMEIDLFRNDGLIHDVVSGVTVDARDIVWVATYFGLSSYDGRKWRNFMDHDSPLLSNFINFCVARGEFCWIATDTGLNATDRERWWSYSIDEDSGEGVVVWSDGGEETVHRPDTFFPHNYVLGVSFQGSDIWVSTEEGIARGSLAGERAQAGAVPAGAGAR